MRKLLVGLSFPVFGFYLLTSMLNQFAMSSPFPGDAAVITGNATSSDLAPSINTNESKNSTSINNTNQTTVATVDNP
jgi:hypothetical protein